MFSFFQSLQLLVCDWLLATRTEVWEREKSGGEKDVVSQTELIAFQQDLASLRKLAHNNKTALPRVSNLSDSSSNKAALADSHLVDSLSNGNNLHEKTYFPLGKFFLVYPILAGAYTETNTCTKISNVINFFGGSKYLLPGR